ncbi:TPA: hypothetical protein DEP26_00430, partial [Candidatus Uhrbacteria bacterium]|nr:hypothetical protein [Candidatus Uhrbacteria bacterium]
LVAGTNISLSGDTLNVDDAFLLNTGDTGSGDYTFTGSIDLTPNSNVDALDITGTNMTSASAIDLDMINTSGNIIDLSLAPTAAGASTAQGMTIAANPATGATVSGDLLELTMDGVDASSFTGDGLKIVVDTSQNTGRPLRIEDDTTATIFMVEESGDITTAGDLAVNGDNITADGNLSIDSAAGSQLLLANSTGVSATLGNNSLDQIFLRTDSGTDYQDIYLYGGVTFDDEVYFGLGATEDVFIEKLSASTDALKLTSSVVATNDNIDGLVIDHTLVDSDLSAALRVSAHNTNNGTAIDTFYGMYLQVDDNSGAQDDTAYGLYIESTDNGISSPDLVADALIVLVNNDNTTADLVADGILFDSQGGLITDAIDASHTFIVNALNIGANAIVGSYFNVAETTGAVTLTQQAVGTSPFTVTGLAASTVAALDLNVESAGGSVIDIDWTSETATAAVSGIDVDMSNLTGDGATTVYGLHLNDPATTTSATEYGIYQQGTNWDYGLYVEDDAYFASTITFAGSIAPDSLDLTPSTNIDALDITGTNMTSASAIDLDMINTSGNIIDLSLAPTAAGASTAQGMTIAANPATGATVSGDLLELTMDGVDASSFTGDGLKIVVDTSQNTGRPLRIEDDTTATIFMVEESGDITTAGDLAVNGGNISSSGALDINPTGNLTVTLADGESMLVDGDTSPTTDLLVLGTGDTSSSVDGVDVLSIISNITNVNGAGLRFTPSYSTNVAKTVGIITIDAFTASAHDGDGGDNGRDLTLSALEVGTLTEDVGWDNEEVFSVALRIADGWDSLIATTDTTPNFTIPGDSVLTFNDNNNHTLMTLTAESTFNTGSLALTGDLAVNGNNITSTGALDINPTGDFSTTLASTESFYVNAISADSANTGGAIDLDVDVNQAPGGDVLGMSIDFENTAGGIANIAESHSALDILVTQNGADEANDDNLYGLHIEELGGIALDANEYGIYQQGTNWDYGLYVEDDAYFASTITFAGSIAPDSLDLTPSTNIDALDITGTNMTSASAIDLDMINTSGNIIDLSLAPTAAGASTAQGISLSAMPATGATVSGDLLELTMDGVDASSFTGDGLKIVVDKSQNTGRPIRIEDDTTATIFMVEENGNITLAGTHIDGSGALTLDSGGGTLQVYASGGNLSLDASSGTIELGADTMTADNSLTINTVLTGDITVDSGTTGTVNLGTGNNAKTINIGTGTAGNTIYIGTNNTVADTISIGSALDTLSLTGSASSLIDFANFDIAATTNAVTLTRQATGTSPLTITGLADSTLADIDLNTSLNQGTIIDVDYKGAETLAAALTGMSLNLQTNVTSATAVNVIGYDLLMPALTSTSSTTYTGYGISSAGALTHSTAGTLSWRGYHAQMPNITETSGTLQSSGFVAEVGTMTTGGTQNGFSVIATGTDVGTLNGLNIGSITAGAGTENAININTGWDSDISLQNGETIENAVDGTIALRDGNTALIAASTATLQFNLDDTTTYTQRLCHSQSDTWTGVANVGDCNSVGQADYAEIYPTATDVSYGDILVPGTTPVVTEHGDTMVQLVKSSQTYTPSFTGIAVDNWEDGSSIGYNIADADHPLPVALVGRVLVNVTDENGPIAVGDPITTSSTSGYGMKATKTGMIIGFALADYTDAGAGQVMVYLQSGWYAGNVISTDGSSTLIADEVVMDSLGEADASTTAYNSHGLTMRGSAWDGSVAQEVGMTFMTDVTDTSNYRLSVRNTAETEVAYVTNDGTLSIAGDMIITGRLYPSDQGVAQTDKYIYYDGSLGPGGDMMRTNASGWATGSYDFAEMFPSNEVLQPGEVVVFAGDGAKVRRASKVYDTLLAGIVSTRPGFLAGEMKAGDYPIALAGRVPTKVSLENGNIQVGDPLTTSTRSGYAMKATESGMIVGYALEPYSGASEQDDSIVVFVNVSHFVSQQTTTTLGVHNTASEFVQGYGVSYTSLSMSGNIYMAGFEIGAIGRMEGLSHAWSIEQDGTIKTQSTLNTVIESYQLELVETSAVTSPQVMISLAGSGELVNGEVEIHFEDVDPSFNDVISVHAPLFITVTPNNAVSLYVSEKNSNGFTVKQVDGSSTTKFDWIVMAYRRDYQPEDKPEPEVAHVVENETGENVSEEEVIIPPEEIIEEETDEVGVVTEETIIQEEVVEEDLAISESPIEIEESQGSSDEGDQIVEPPSETQMD